MYISETSSTVIASDLWRCLIVSASLVIAQSIIAIIFIKLFRKSATITTIITAIFILLGVYIMTPVISVPLKYLVNAPTYNKVEKNLTISGIGTIKKNSMESRHSMYHTIYTVDSNSADGFKIEKLENYPTYIVWAKFRHKHKQTTPIKVHELYLTDEQAKAIKKYNVGEKVFIKVSGTGKVLEVRKV